ncbi:MAG: hypothetical protein IKB55_05450 [Clostridia bacterium]|nr:hypothetical protein [Clostridia bacterium]
MKKIICLILILLIVSVTAFAGSIPEDLLSQEDSKLFVGKVQEYTILETPNAPYFDIGSITVVPTEKIKGDVEIGKAQTYNRCSSEVKPVLDTEYLFAYFDEINFYLYEIKERNGNKFSLKNSRFPMVKRLEDNLNNGIYAEAEKERIETAVAAQLPQENPKPDTNFGWWVVGGAAVIGAVIIAAYKIISKK